MTLLENQIQKLLNSKSHTRSVARWYIICSVHEALGSAPMLRKKVLSLNNDFIQLQKSCSSCFQEQHLPHDTVRLPSMCQKQSNNNFLVMHTPPSSAPPVISVATVTPTQHLTGGPGEAPRPSSCINVRMSEAPRQLIPREQAGVLSIDPQTSSLHRLQFGPQSVTPSRPTITIWINIWK